MINSPGFSIRPIQVQIPALLISKVLLEVDGSCSEGACRQAVKGRFAEVQRGSRDHQRAGKHPATSSSGKLPTLFLPPGLEKLSEQLGLGKRCSLGREPWGQKSWPDTFCQSGPPEREQEHKYASLSFLLALQVPPRADPSESERECKLCRDQPPRAQSSTKNGSRRTGREYPVCCVALDKLLNLSEHHSSFLTWEH